MQAQTLVGERNGALVQALDEKAPADVAACFADGLVAEPTFVALIVDNAARDELDPATEQQLQELASSIARGARARAAEHRRRAHVRGDQAMKYFASGWGTMIAEVLCSGSSWNSSVSFTPIRSSSSSSSSFAWSSRSGHAG